MKRETSIKHCNRFNLRPADLCQQNLQTHNRHTTPNASGSAMGWKIHIPSITLPGELPLCFTLLVLCDKLAAWWGIRKPRISQKLTQKPLKSDYVITDHWLLEGLVLDSGARFGTPQCNMGSNSFCPDFCVAIHPCILPNQISFEGYGTQTSKNWGTWMLVTTETLCDWYDPQCQLTIILSLHPFSAEAPRFSNPILGRVHTIQFVCEHISG